MKITDIKPLSQRDPKWANILLGFNTDYRYTIGGYGCLITCLSMMTEDAVDYMNVRLKDVDGFVSGGFYVWGAITNVYGDIKEELTRTPSPLTDTQMREINLALDTGKPVMVEIDAIPSTSKADSHFVLLIARNPEDEDDFTTLDPWDGKKKSLKEYLSGTKPTARRSIEQYAIYSGTGHLPAEESDSDCEKKVEELREQREKYREEIRGLKKKVELAEKTLASADGEIKSWKERMAKCDVAVANKVIAMEALQSQIDIKDLEISNMGIEITRLRKEVENMTDNTNTKVWYESKTMWVGILSAVGGICTALAGHLSEGGVITAMGLIQIVLRVITNTKVTLRK